MGPKDLLLSRSYVLPEISFVSNIFGSFTIFRFLKHSHFRLLRVKRFRESFHTSRFTLTFVYHVFLWEQFTITADIISLVIKVGCHVVKVWKVEYLDQKYAQIQTLLPFENFRFKLFLLWNFLTQANRSEKKSAFWRLVCEEMSHIYTERVDKRFIVLLEV